MSAIKFDGSATLLPVHSGLAKDNSNHIFKM
jgi:hypothetical protein